MSASADTLLAERLGVYGQGPNKRYLLSKCMGVEIDFDIQVQVEQLTICSPVSGVKPLSGAVAHAETETQEWERAHRLCADALFLAS